MSTLKDSNGAVIGFNNNGSIFNACPSLSRKQADKGQIQAPINIDLLNEQLRRIPLEAEFMKKNINDILYGRLQAISYMNDDKVRFVYKDSVNFSDLERLFGIDDKGNYRLSRLKLSRALKVLLAQGFVIEDNVKDLNGNMVPAYVLPFKEDSIYKLVPLKTLKFLVNTGNSNVIKVYTYLLNKWEWKGLEYHFTKKELILNCLGMKNDSNKRDYELITNILDCLKNNDLIDFAKYTRIEKGVPVPRTRLTNVSKYYKSYENDTDF